MLLLNALIFQLGWLACVIGGDNFALVFTAIALTLHHFFFIKKPMEWLLVFAITIVGLGWDALMVAFGILNFDNDLILGLPVWLICLWLIFATTFNHCLRWFQTHLFLAALLGAVFAPLSYWIGAQLSSASIGLPLINSMAYMAAGWLLLFPLGLHLNKTFLQRTTHDSI